MSKETHHAPAPIPAPGVHGIAPGAAAAVRAWATGAGQHWSEVPLAAVATRRDALVAIGRALGFPDHYGINLDALYDCLTDLPDRNAAAGWVIHLNGLDGPNGLAPSERRALLDVFDAAAGDFTARGRALRVLHD